MYVFRFLLPRLRCTVKSAMPMKRKKGQTGPNRVGGQENELTPGEFLKT
jgi:hypothetical protein